MDNEKIEKLLKNIGIEQRGHIIDGIKGKKYMIELQDSNEYARAYTLLDKFKKANMDDEGSMTSEYQTVLSYYIPNGDTNYLVMLNANFNDDFYSIVIREVEDERSE